jgi:predicted phosphatase
VADWDSVLRLAAEMMIEHHGGRAARIARDAAKTAKKSGDLLSTDAWRKVAHAIDALRTGVISP